ncbi:hypothetical protein [Kingella bonacorsii]|uniref:Uncharacterized protein n=1 Tax=Kingella bonacorsii TaxID=2796361 RepID=A0ABS1BT28_9NEIS|nr:hypothetical protein [Kingella bonacorsii]MBK0396408.1 hypothetical protein [Kingella bonacorsii]
MLSRFRQPEFFARPFKPRCGLLCPRPMFSGCLCMFNKGSLKIILPAMPNTFSGCLTQSYEAARKLCGDSLVYGW